MERKYRLVRPTYFECKRIIRRLQDFKNLLFYYCPYAGYEKRATSPLSEYIETEGPQYERKHRIEEQISRRVSLIDRDLRYLGVPCIVTFDKGEESEVTYDIFFDIFAFLRNDRGSARNYDLLLDSINRGIGLYEAKKRKEGRRLFNPLYWISLVLKVPLLIIEGADLVNTEEAGKTIFRIYAWTIRILMLIILLLIAKKLGVDVHILKA